MYISDPIPGSVEEQIVTAWSQAFAADDHDSMIALEWFGRGWPLVGTTISWWLELIEE